jgi:hypothetical protein
MNGCIPLLVGGRYTDMARFKLSAEGDLFNNEELGEFASLEEAAEKVIELENAEQYIGYEFVLIDTLLRVEYFFSDGDWQKA